MSKYRYNKFAPEKAPQSDAIKADDAEQQAPVDTVEFDAWFVMRADKIAKHHRKEIIKADFEARGLGDKDSVANFDKALAKYGIKLS